MTETLLPPSSSSSPLSAPRSAGAPTAGDEDRATAAEVALARAVLDGHVAADEPTDALLTVLSGARARLTDLLGVLGQAADPAP